MLNELIQNGAAPMQTAGLAIWTGMATVMIVWTGLKTAFSGDYDMWEIVKLGHRPEYPADDAGVLRHAPSRGPP